MKKLLIGLLLLVALAALVLFAVSICTPVDTQTSPDGKYTAVLEHEVGLNPGNRMDGRIELRMNGRMVAFTEEAFWYGPFGDADLRVSKDSWNVVWEDDKVIITLYGLYSPQNGERVIEWALD